MNYSTSPTIDLLMSDDQQHLNDGIETESLARCVETAVDPETVIKSWQDNDTARDVNHETFHGPEPLTESDSADILDKYVPRIRRSLDKGNTEMLRVGHWLCHAKDDLKRGSNLSEELDMTFTEWYTTNLNISEDKARQLMRCARPFSDDVDWEDNDDALLAELGTIGICVLDVLRKMDRSWWKITENSILLLTNGEETPIRSLSLREVKSFLNAHGSPSSDDARKGNSESEGEGEGERPVEGDGKGEPQVEGEDEGEGEGEGNQPVEGKGEGEGEDSASSQNTPVADLTKVSKCWTYGSFRRESLMVIEGHITDLKKDVFGVNVKLTFDDVGCPVPHVIDRMRRAFYTLVDTKTTDYHQCLPTSSDWIHSHIENNVSSTS